MMDSCDLYRLLFICMLYQGCICHSCPSTCIYCEFDNYCRECKPGLYGDVCSETCKSYCRNNKCSKYLGLCDSCEDGYFLNKDLLCIKCPINCLKCTSTEFCLECVTGFRGEICHEQCINCKKGTPCDKITGHCITCNDGFSGLLCDTKCNPKCRSCKRIENNECISCSRNTYGENCNYSCSSNCLEAACNKTDGSCTLGCSTGYWGSRCNNTCDALCQNSRCSKEDGNCTRIGENKKLSRSLLEDVSTILIVLCVLLVAATFFVYLITSGRLSKVFRLCCNEVRHPIPTNESVQAPLNGAGKVLGAYCIYDTDGRRAYIGCKDPKTNDEISEFWEMVWNEGCNIIVMLTGTDKKLPSGFYGSKIKEKVKHGSILVETYALTYEDDCAERMINLKKDDCSKGNEEENSLVKAPDQKKITVFQLRARITSSFNVQKLVERVRVNTETKLFGPVLVHSSDGVRMCGVYMALDMYHKNLKQNTTISEISDRLREQNYLLLRDKSEMQVLNDQQVNG